MIQHVALEVARQDGDACAAFWALLGFAEVEPPPTLRERSRWLQRDGTQIHLTWPEHDPVASPTGHVAVVVDDYDATLAALDAAGFETEARPEHWGASRSFVRDPAGHRIEVMSAPPP